MGISVRLSRRRTAGTLLSIVIAGSLSACSGADDQTVSDQPVPVQSAPKPTGTACALADTAVVWEPMVEALAAHLGHRVLTVSDDGTQSQVDEHAPYSSAVQAAEGLAVGGEQVLNYLMNDLAVTGHAESDRVGNPPENFDRVSVTEIPAGTYVMGYRVSQFTSAFTLTCDGKKVGGGTLLSTEGNDAGGTLVGCTQPPTSSTDTYSLSLKDKCPAP